MTRLHYAGQPVQVWPKHVYCYSCKKSCCCDCLELVAEWLAGCLGIAGGVSRGRRHGNASVPS